MMKQFALVLVLLVMASAAFAVDTNAADQTFKLGVNSVAKLAVSNPGGTGTGAEAFTLMIAAPALNDAAGALPSPDSNNATYTYLYYTSIVANANSTAAEGTGLVSGARKISVGTASFIPDGCLLSVSAAAPTSANLKGTVAGTTTGPGDIAMLSLGAGRDLLTNIANCRTGNASGDGARVTWGLRVNDTPAGWLALHSQVATNCTVTYTLSGD
jgi:hypothetical protein